MPSIVTKSASALDLWACFKVREKMKQFSLVIQRKHFKLKQSNELPSVNTSYWAARSIFILVRRWARVVAIRLSNGGSLSGSRLECPMEAIWTRSQSVPWRQFWGFSVRVSHGNNLSGLAVWVSHGGSLRDSHLECLTDRRAEVVAGVSSTKLTLDRGQLSRHKKSQRFEHGSFIKVGGDEKVFVGSVKSNIQFSTKQ